MSFHPSNGNQPLKKHVKKSYVTSHDLIPQGAHSDIQNKLKIIRLYTREPE